MFLPAEPHPHEPSTSEPWSALVHMAGSLHGSDIKGLLSVFWSLHSCHLVGGGGQHEEVFNLLQKP